MLDEDTQGCWEASCAEEWVEGRDRKVRPSSTSEYPGTSGTSLEHTEFLCVTITAIRLWDKEGSNKLWSLRWLLYCFKQWYTCPVLFKCSHLAKISEATLTAPALPPSEVPPTTTRWEQNPSSWFLYCFQHSPKPWNHTVKLCHSLGRINRPGGKKPTQTKKWANEKE